MVVFRRSNHNEQLGTFQIRAAELPERAADGIDHASGHVHRTQTTVGGIVGCAVLFGEQAGKRLHLVSTGEQGEFFGISGADMRQPFFHDGKRFFPGDFFKIVVAAITAGLAHQRFGQASR